MAGEPMETHDSFEAALEHLADLHREGWSGAVILRVLPSGRTLIAMVNRPGKHGQESNGARRV